MPDPEKRIDRWWGGGIVFQLTIVLCGLVTVYYTRMQALVAVATGQESLAKIHDETKANFDKLEATLRQTNERLVKLETSQQVARQDAAISDLQTKLAELEARSRPPADVSTLRSTIDDINRMRAAQATGLENPSSGTALRILPKLEHSTGLLLKDATLPSADKKSLSEMLDEIRTTQEAPVRPFNALPKFEWKPTPTPKEQTGVERIVGFLKTYGFLIFILLVAAFSSKR